MAIYASLRSDLHVISLIPYEPTHEAPPDCIAPVKEAEQTCEIRLELSMNDVGNICLFELFFVEVDGS